MMLEMVYTYSSNFLLMTHLISGDEEQPMEAQPK